MGRVPMKSHRQRRKEEESKKVKKIMEGHKKKSIWDKEMKELLWGKKDMSLAEKIRSWALWFILFIILMTCFKILGFW